MSIHKNMVITTASGLTIVTPNILLAKNFWFEGNTVEYEDGSTVFSDNNVNKEKPKSIYPVWFDDKEKNALIANWEKTGMFGSIVKKLHAAEFVKGTK